MRLDRRSERRCAGGRGLVLLTWLSAALLGCADAAPDSPDPEALVRVEDTLDRFYAWDATGLAALVARAEGAEALLYYQGWAEAAHYRVLDRRPCAGASATRVVCAVTVRDDFGQALGYTATDTFIFEVGPADVAPVRVE